MNVPLVPFWGTERERGELRRVDESIVYDRGGE